LTDVFQVQADIAARASNALGLALTGSDEKRLRERPTDSLAAYDAYLKAEVASKGDLVDVRRAREHYEQAVVLDPTFAQAWAGLSLACSSLHDGSPSAELSERAKAAADRAIALAPEDPQGYIALGEFLYWVRYDARDALEQLTKAQGIAPADLRVLTSLANLEASLGLWKEAEEHIREAERLDPRSAFPKRMLAAILTVHRRFPAAREVLGRARQLDAPDVGYFSAQVLTYLGEGDLAGARTVVQSALKVIEPTTLIAHLASANDLVWVLDESQREILFRLPPSAFNARETWALALAHTYALKEDRAQLRVFAEEARKTLETQLRESPDAPMAHVLHGVALAYLGRRDEAVRQGQRGVALEPVSKNAWFGPYHQLQLVKTYILIGEPEKALDYLEPLLEVPYILTPAWLAIDPTFDPLRGHPRFKALVAGA
jgi:tetratricopeptide (TPR) repeat protein